MERGLMDPEHAHTTPTTRAHLRARWHAITATGRIACAAALSLALSAALPGVPTWASSPTDDPTPAPATPGDTTPSATTPAAGESTPTPTPPDSTTTPAADEPSSPTVTPTAILVDARIRPAWNRLKAQLGNPTAQAAPVAGGIAQRFDHGIVVWSSATGAHGLVGPTFARFQALGGIKTTGFPRTDTAALNNYPGATVISFTKGTLIASDRGTRWLDIDAATYYFAHGAAKAIGVPTGDTARNNARSGSFKNDTSTRFSMKALIYHNIAAHSTYSVRGAIYSTWLSVGGADGPLGRPWSDAYVSGRTTQKFSTGVILDGPRGFRVVRGSVWKIYKSSIHRAGQGDLGLPTGNTSSNGKVQDFQNARIDGNLIRVRPNATTRKTTRADVLYTYRSGCPVGPASLRTIDLNYLGFDHRVHRGQIIVRSDIVTQTINSFGSGDWSGFPIRHITNPNHYRGNDYKMMADDNSSAFNCRKVSGNPYAVSPHSYGRAIDINDFENPFKELGRWFPYKNWYATHRSGSKPGVLTSNSAIVKRLVGYGFFWGAWWWEPDYQHFQLNKK